MISVQSEKTLKIDMTIMIPELVTVNPMRTETLSDGNGDLVRMMALELIDMANATMTIAMM